MGKSNGFLRDFYRDGNEEEDKEEVGFYMGLIGILGEDGWEF